MFYMLLILLLTGCHALRVPYAPRYAFEQNSLPLGVQTVSLVIADSTSACTDAELDIALAEWAKKRFVTNGTGVLEVVIRTAPISNEVKGEGISQRRVIADVHVRGNKDYAAVDLQIELYRTNHKFGDQAPRPGTEEWAEYMTNFVQTIDAQILHGLRQYAPKLLSDLPLSVQAM